MTETWRGGRGADVRSPTLERRRSGRPDSAGPGITSPAMNGRLLFKDCTLLHADGRLEPGRALSVVDRHIEAIAADADLPLLPGDWWVDCGGRALAPGLVDCHTALPDLAEPTLTPAELELLTAHALAEGLLRGVTSRALQLHAPRGALALLEAQSRAASSVGVRTLLSVGPRATDGLEAALGQLEDVRALAGRLQHHPDQRALLGWTGPAPGDAGFHARVGEAFAAAGTPLVIDRRRAGQGHALTGSEALAAPDWVELPAMVVGAELLDANARARLIGHGSLLALGAASHASPALLDEGAALGLFGDGWTRGVTRAAWGLEAAATSAGLDDDRVAQVIRAALVQAPAAWLSAQFGVPLGRLEPGAAADLVLYDWVPQARGREALAQVRDQLEARVWWTVMNGRVVVREGALLGPDGGALAREAAALHAARGGGQA